MPQSREQLLAEAAECLARLSEHEDVQRLAAIAAELSPSDLQQEIANAPASIAIGAHRIRKALRP